MKRILLFSITVVLASGCLPTRESKPFGEGETNNGQNNGSDAGNNGTDDAANNTVADAANNRTPDAANNGVLDAANNATPDMNVDLGPDPCVPESDEMFCERQGAECSTLTSTDNCGVQRSVNCGACPNAETCDNNICGGCVPESDAELCNRLMAECGQLTALDNCRDQRTANCGGCAGTGVGCNLMNSCQEINCSDGVDNDGVNGADCADPACRGQQCGPNPNKRCQADATCN